MYSAPHSGAPASHSRTELTTAIAGRATRKPTSRTGTRPQCPRFRCTTSGLHRSSNISAGQLERGTHSETEAYSGVGRCQGVFGSTLKDTYMTGDERDRQRRSRLSRLSRAATVRGGPSRERARSRSCVGVGVPRVRVPRMGPRSAIRLGVRARPCPLVVCCAYSAVQRPAVQRRPGAGRQQHSRRTRQHQNAPERATHVARTSGCGCGVRGCLLVGTKVTVPGG